MPDADATVDAAEIERKRRVFIDQGWFTSEALADSFPENIEYWYQEVERMTAEAEAGTTAADFGGWDQQDWTAVAASWGQQDPMRQEDVVAQYGWMPQYMLEM